MQKRNRFVSELGGSGAKQLIWVSLGSFGVHLLLFVGLFWIHDFDFLKPSPKIVRVDLVSFAPGPVGGTAAFEPVSDTQPEPAADTVNIDPAPTPPATAPAEPQPVPVIKPDVSLKTKPKNIKELMAARKEEKKAPVKKKKSEKVKPKPKKNPEKELKQAREALAKKIEAENKSKIDEALKRMQAAIKDRQAGTDAVQGPGSGQGTGMGQKGSSPLTLYQMVLKSAIEQNWVFNEMMAGMDQNLEVSLFVKILKNGEIRDVAYETRSGNRYLDESAKKAILRASPLPELPKGMSSYEPIIVFTPRGLK